MANALLTTLFALTLATVAAIGKHRPYTALHPDEEASFQAKLVKNLKMESKTFNAKVDHFNASKEDTYSMRYIIDRTNVEEGTRSPILFYAGNEGPVTGFWEASGFITDTLAKEMKATVVFAEHRYYGESLPMAPDTFSKENLKFLDVRQVIMDYVDLLDYLKPLLSLENEPVYVFGGSYGGMLAAWMRQKFPNKFDGAIAASAPVRWFDGVIWTSNYTNQVAYDIVHLDQGGQECFDGLKDGFFDMLSLVYDGSQYKKIQDTFHVCDDQLKTPQDMQNLISFLQDSIAGQAQTNYPYPITFMGEEIPAWPLKATCKALTDYKPPSEVGADPKPGSVFDFNHINALAAAGQVAYNNSKKPECLDITMPTEPNAWEIQTCSQLPMPQGDDPSQSCFTWQNFDKDAWTKYCQDKYGLTPQYSWALDYFGGRNPSKDWEAASNIVYTNGDLDPWRGGGLNVNYTDTMVAYGMKDAAHHLDLRLPNKEDPIEVVEGRNIHRKNLNDWYSAWKTSHPDPTSFI